jgi:hypothetical protein
MFPSTRETLRPAPRSWRARAGRALGLAWAFLTLDDESGAPLPAEPPHPHRRPLRSTLGPRRPGAGEPGAQLCATARPLRPAGRRAEPQIRR